MKKVGIVHFGFILEYAYLLVLCLLPRIEFTNFYINAFLPLFPPKKKKLAGIGKNHYLCSSF